MCCIASNCDSRDNGNHVCIKDQGLSGTLNGRDFYWDLPEGLPGRSTFLMDVEYGVAANLVWVYSHYRYHDGITLFDVANGTADCGWAGYSFSVSNDRRHVAYEKAGIYGALHAVAVDDLLVFPRIRKQSPEEMGAALLLDSQFRMGVPDQALNSPIYWIGPHSIGFLVQDNAQIAEAADDPDLGQYWWVRVDRLTAPYRSSEITRSRVQLSVAAAEQLSKGRAKRPPVFSPKQLKNARPVRESDWHATTGPKELQKLVLPNAQRGILWKSPDGKHEALAIRTGFTFFHYQVILFVDGTMVYPIVHTGFDPKSYHKGVDVRPQTLSGVDYRNISPGGLDSRLMAEPRWEAVSVSFPIREHWLRREVLGDQSREQNFDLRVRLHEPGDPNASDVTSSSLNRAPGAE
jgi:hypothetical protein